MKYAFVLLLVLAALSSSYLRAADRDDLYSEFVVSTGLNLSGRHRIGAIVGFVPRNDIGVGVGFEQHYSTSPLTRDEMSSRGLLELRWFQEPFEFAADVGIIQSLNRDSSTRMQASFGVNTAYLVALTPSLAAKADFAFLFLDEPRVLFSGGLGLRILF